MSSEKEHDSGVYLAGARAALPFALATFVLGISFGVLARSLGWGVVAPIVFSVIAFSGSAQSRWLRCWARVVGRSRR